MKKKILLVKGNKINDIINKNELESLFIDSVEVIRKDIMKRRLKIEVTNRKRLNSIDLESD